MPVYMSLMKRPETIEVNETTYISNELVKNVASVTQTNDVQIVSQNSKVGRPRKTNLTNKQVVENEMVVNVPDRVSQKSKGGRPRKIGKTLENDVAVEKISPSKSR